MDGSRSNRSLGERVHDALVKAAEAKSAADRAEKLCKRVFSQLVISGTGKSIAEKEHAARCHLKYTEAEDDWQEKATTANVAKAEADGLGVQFEEYRTRAATARAEMNLR